MPDRPIYTKRTHPLKMPRRPTSGDTHRHRRQAPRYAELRCRSNFSFLRGASHPEELAEQAAKLGYAALAVTDRNTLAGIVRMHCAAKACNLNLIIGAEVTPIDAPPVTLYATDRAAYGRLCRIITQGRLRAPKGSCKVTLADIDEWNQGLLAAVLNCGTTTCDDLGRPAGFNAGGGANTDTCSADSPAPRRLKPAAQDSIEAYRDIFGDRLYLAASAHGGADDGRHLAETDALARATGVPMVATNDVHYHEPNRRFLQDVLVCIREHCTLQEAGRKLFANAERHLKPVEEMQRIFADHPKAIIRTVEIADRCRFSLDELRYEYPEALCPADRSPDKYLAELTWAGARERYPGGVPDKVRRLIEHELKLIRQLDYEPYFLTVWDIVKFARSRDILCQGRGSAANSAVCYCLGITSVDPDQIDLLFERFVSTERNEPPDIDVDFEHERREEVFQYIYDKYGRDHAGIVAEAITYRPRSAIRDVGKALGLSLDRIAALAKQHEWWDKDVLPEDFVRETGFDPSNRTVCMLRKLVRQIIGFPRHLSQHVGGFVITRGPLCEMVPIENAAMPDRTFIEWDKDDIDALGILKIDCLALGMLTAIHKCFQIIDGHGEGEGGSDEATERRSDEGTESWNNGGLTEWRDEHAGEDVSRFDRLAEGDGTGEADLSGNQCDARNRAVRVDGTNAKSCGIHPIEHRRGARPGKSNRVRSFSTNRPRLVDGTSDAIDPGRTGEPDPHSGATRPNTSGNRSCLTGSDPQPGSDPKVDHTPVHQDRAHHHSTSIPPTPPSLRRFVASSLSLSTIPPEDPAVYDMICRADTVGVFQIESRAQMSMLPRLKPRGFYDLVIEVAIVRPGPIQGGMVHPYLRRRNGEEPVEYPNEAIKEVLKRTLGVPLFQEQAMRLAVVAAGFTPGEADQLRRAMGAWRRNGDITGFRTKLIEGMTANGLSEKFAQRCFEQICGFGEYGFPESHAASFALLVYVSAWLKRYHPAAFCAAIINSQPMGFYQPAQLVRDAREHGVTVLPVDVNYSGYDCRLERATERRSHEATKVRSADLSSWGVGGPAVRLGMRLVKGISRVQVEGIERVQRERPFTSVVDLAHRSGAPRATLARLATADAMGSLGLNRREALWQVLALGDDPAMLKGHEPDEPEAQLPELSPREVVVADYDTMGLSLSAHPMALIRKELSGLRVQQARILRKARQGQWMEVAGLVLVRQRPSTAKGIVFCTLEDETGTANLIIRPNIYEKNRRAARGAVALVAQGRVERQGEVVHLQVTRLADLSTSLAELGSVSRNFH